MGNLLVVDCNFSLCNGYRIHRIGDGFLFATDQDALVAIGSLPGDQLGVAIKGKVRVGSLKFVEVVSNGCVHVILLSINR